MRRLGLDVLLLLLAREEALDARTHCFLDKGVCARPVNDGEATGQEQRNEKGMEEDEL